MDTKASRLRGALTTACEDHPSLIANDRFREALEKIRKLERDGHKVAGESEQAILLFAYLAVQRTRPPRREDWEQCWARYTGKTWKALTEFPGRIRGIAEEVERLSGSHYFDPTRAITSEIPLAIYAKREFPILPATLGGYANWLEAQVKSISALMKYFYRRAPRSRSPFILHVSEQVKLITGRFCDSEVAELLDAADLVVNPGKTNPDKGFDAQTLALLRSRQKRRTRKR